MRDLPCAFAFSLLLLAQGLSCGGDVESSSPDAGDTHGDGASGEVDATSLSSDATDRSDITTVEIDAASADDEGVGDDAILDDAAMATDAVDAAPACDANDKGPRGCCVVQTDCEPGSPPELGLYCCYMGMCVYCGPK
jgi:hypothetical protein